MGTFKPIYSNLFSEMQPLCPELVLNTALVSLGCKLGDPTNQKVIHGDEIIPSKGFGVVTGINQEKKLLYLKTALNDQELSSINCLTSGSMLVPNGYFLKKAKPGHPYVQAKPNLETPLNIPWQRSAKPRLQEFQQQQNNK